MCLAIPGCVVSVVADGPLFRRGMVEFLGIQRECNLACVPEARVGDFVVVHAGVAIAIVNEEAARQTLTDLAPLRFADPGPAREADNAACG